jgi:hypothetical protein
MEEHSWIKEEEATNHDYKERLYDLAQLYQKALFCFAEVCMATNSARRNHGGLGAGLQKHDTI